ncbi:MAG: hypothetical protein P1U65_18675 [Minwuia sp.]|nr:hypothetical protein [Minwuia sp.]
MKYLLAAIGLAIALLLGGAWVSWTDDFKKGFNAAENGDHATALREWTPLAEQGLAIAQHNLGLMYALGEGIPKAPVYAHMWGSIAASNGNRDGGKVRNLAAEQMTPSQIVEARNRARECIRKNYKGC